MGRERRAKQGYSSAASECIRDRIATATGGIPEVVVDGRTGWLVPIDLLYPSDAADV